MPTTTKLLVSERDRKTWEFTSWGEREFAAQPRLGELIKRDVDGTVHVFVVIAVLHSDSPEASSCEIWVEDRGALSELQKPNSGGNFGFLGA